MTPDELFALAIFVLTNYGRGSGPGGLEGLLLASLLAGSALSNMFEEDMGREQDLGFADFLARHNGKSVD